MKYWGYKIVIPPLWDAETAHSNPACILEWLKWPRLMKTAVPPLLDGLLNGYVYTSGKMGSKTRFLPKTFARKGTKRTQPPSLSPSLSSPSHASSRRIPDTSLRFRVLVIGRANAGKTSILQRVCDTTESPKIYRRGEEVRSTNFVYKSDLTDDQVKLKPSIDVSDTSIHLHLPLNTVSARRRRFHGKPP